MRDWHKRQNNRIIVGNTLLILKELLIREAIVLGMVPTMETSGISISILLLKVMILANVFGIVDCVGEVVGWRMAENFGITSNLHIIITLICNNQIQK